MIICIIQVVQLERSLIKTNERSSIDEFLALLAHDAVEIKHSNTGNASINALLMYSHTTISQT